MAELTDSQLKNLGSIIDKFNRDEQPTRDNQIRMWKKYEYMWNGIDRIWWDEAAKDYKIQDPDEDDDYYDKPINVFRPFLESIIAAATASVPAVKCVPDDANVPDDIETAKVGDKIGTLLYKHLDAPLLFMKAWYIYCTQGMVASYRYTEKDKSFGTFKKDKYKDTEEEQEVKTCPTCGRVFNQADLDNEENFEGYEDGNEEDTSKVLCPVCLSKVEPKAGTQKVPVHRFVGTTDEPKSRQKLEVLGGLFVKVPNYARTQQDLPYVAYEYETHYTNILAKYKGFASNLRERASGNSLTSAVEPNDVWGRLNIQYGSDNPPDTPTVGLWWLRASAFESINDDGERNELLKAFPDGVKVTKVNEHIIQAESENLDDHWTFTQNPLSEYLHFAPHGSLLEPIQEIISALIFLILQTIEHGIPQTFADPKVIDFNAYGKSPAKPGMISPAKPPAGGNINQSFYEVKTATLSREVQPFGDKIQELGQFASGALPSLFGGEQKASSRTAAQYSMSGARAMQRLQIPWKMLTFFWKNTFGKLIPGYIKDMQEDVEKFTDKSGGNYITTYIRKSELQGKIGSIELEAAEQLPITWQQKKDVLMSLLQSNNPLVASVLSNPENSAFIASALGVDELTIPGEEDRLKQAEEIQLMLQNQPTNSLNPMTGMPEEAPSVPVDPIVDNHAMEAAACRAWLISDVGRQVKLDNPPAYKNILLHLKAHLDAAKPMMQQGAQANPNNNKPIMAATAKQPQELENA